MDTAVNESHGELDTFIDFLFDGLEGYVYLAARDPKDPNPETNWKQEFFLYPQNVGFLKDTIRRASVSHEIYIGPAIFKSPSALKENVKGSNVVWTDFDGNPPEWQDVDVEYPSLIVRSSDDSHIHCYWRLAEPCYDVKTIETINRTVTYGLSADSSGWDANQILRPPETLNHKPERKGARVAILDSNGTSYDSDIFSNLPVPPTQAEEEAKWQLGSLPDVEDVILKYPFGPDMVLLLKKTQSDLKEGTGRRARALVNLAHGCCELGMTNAEAFAMLSYAAARWDKFTGRKDRNKRLAHILTVARNKHPEIVVEDEEQFAFAFDFLSFLDTDIEIEWAIEPMLMERGAMLLVGPSGVGKTQITLQFMIHIALGKDFLHYKIKRPMKLVFLSLEMDHGSLKIFLETMAKDLTEEEKQLLAQNFIIVPHGEPWFLNTAEGQKHAIDLIEAVEPEGFFVDSVGSSIRGSLSADEDVQELINFNDKIRKKYGVFTWYIHHVRKTTHNQGGTHTANQDDIYGNQFLLNRATSSYAVYKSKKGSLRIKNFKNRLAPQEIDFFVERTDNLNFQPLAIDSKEEPQSVVYKEPEEKKGPTAGGFML